MVSRLPMQNPPPPKSLLTKMGRAPNWTKEFCPSFLQHPRGFQSSQREALWLCPSVFKFLRLQRGPRTRPLISCFSISQTQEVEDSFIQEVEDLDLPQSKPHETSQLSLTFCFMFAVLMLAKYIALLGMHEALIAGRAFLYFVHESSRCETNKTGVSPEVGVVPTPIIYRKEWHILQEVIINLQEVLKRNF